jgi:hypothetical protein
MRVKLAGAVTELILGVQISLDKLPNPKMNILLGDPFTVVVPLRHTAGFLGPVLNRPKPAGRCRRKARRLFRHTHHQQERAI